MMLNNPYEIVVLTTQDLKDLLDMARKSPGYIEGYAWCAAAMHQGNKALSGALVRNRKFDPHQA